MQAAAGDPGQSFVRADLHQGIAIGAIEPAVALETLEPFVPGEEHWELAGLEMTPERAAIEAKPVSLRPASRSRRPR